MLPKMKFQSMKEMREMREMKETTEDSYNEEERVATVTTAVNADNDAACWNAYGRNNIIKENVVDKPPVIATTTTTAIEEDDDDENEARNMYGRNRRIDNSPAPAPAPASAPASALASVGDDDNNDDNDNDAACWNAYGRNDIMKKKWYGRNHIINNGPASASASASAPASAPAPAPAPVPVPAHSYQDNYDEVLARRSGFAPKKSNNVTNNIPNNTSTNKKLVPPEWMGVGINMLRSVNVDFMIEKDTNTEDITYKEKDKRHHVATVIILEEEGNDDDDDEARNIYGKANHTLDNSNDDDHNTDKNNNNNNNNDAMINRNRNSDIDSTSPTSTTNTNCDSNDSVDGSGSIGSDYNSNNNNMIDHSRAITVVHEVDVDEEKEEEDTNNGEGGNAGDSDGDNNKKYAASRSIFISGLLQLQSEIQSQTKESSLRQVPTTEPITVPEVVAVTPNYYSDHDNNNNNSCGSGGSIDNTNINDDAFSSNSTCWGNPVRGKQRRIGSTGTAITSQNRLEKIYTDLDKRMSKFHEQQKDQKERIIESRSIDIVPWFKMRLPDPPSVSSSTEMYTAIQPGSRIRGTNNMINSNGESNTKKKQHDDINYSSTRQNGSKSISDDSGDEDEDDDTDADGDMTIASRTTDSDWRPPDMKQQQKSTDFVRKGRMEVQSSLESGGGKTEQEYDDTMSVVMKTMDKIKRQHQQSISNDDNDRTNGDKNGRSRSRAVPSSSRRIDFAGRQHNTASASTAKAIRNSRRMRKAAIVQEEEDSFDWVPMNRATQGRSRGRNKGDDRYNDVNEEDEEDYSSSSEYSSHQRYNNDNDDDDDESGSSYDLEAALPGSSSSISPRSVSFNTIPPERFVYDDHCQESEDGNNDDDDNYYCRKCRRMGDTSNKQAYCNGQNIGHVGICLIMVLIPAAALTIIFLVFYP